MAKQIYELDVYIGPEEEEGPPYESEYRGETWDCEIPEKNLVPVEIKERNFRISCGDPGYDPQDWVPWKLTIGCEANHWDFYCCEASTGVFSPRAIEVLRPYFQRDFPLLPVTVNGQSFFMLHANDQLDCLDLEKSEILRLDPPDEHVIVMIEQYVFKKQLIDDPLLFSIPERRTFLFVTESIPKIVEEAGLRGFRFDLLDG